jgi:hypothetical protein
MFAYEGLGSIYWHMVGKLLLAAQESFASAVEHGATQQVIDELGDRYYAIREGIGGFNKAPDVYGAFPLDPYSHTPAHAGAKQPGMTGQVKEEIITRRGELGVRVHDGRVSFQPVLLRKSEFLRHPHKLHSFTVRSEPLSIDLPAGTVAFTCCQVPVVYHLHDQHKIVLTEQDGRTREFPGDTLDSESSRALFSRSGRIARIDVWTTPGR